MSGISVTERRARCWAIWRALHALADHRVDQRDLVRIANHDHSVKVTVTERWVQTWWAEMSTEFHDIYPDLWVIRPQWQWGYLVGATSNPAYVDLAFLMRNRMEIASRMRSDLRDGQVRDRAKVNPTVSTVLASYETAVEAWNDTEREIAAIHGSLLAMPVASTKLIESLMS